MNLLNIAINLEESADLSTVRTVVYVGDTPVLTALNAVSGHEAECIDIPAIIAAAHLRLIVKHITKQGIPNVPTTETQDAGSQSNRTTEAEQESTGAAVWRLAEERSVRG